MIVSFFVVLVVFVLPWLRKIRGIRGDERVYDTKRGVKPSDNRYCH